MATAVVIGSGMMGSALAFPLCDNGHSVRLVGSPLDGHIIASLKEKGYHPTLKFQMPENTSAYTFEELDSALEGADFVVGGVSSFGVDWFSDIVLPRLPMEMPVISVTKGLVLKDDGHLQNFPGYMSGKPSGKGRKLCAIGGPCTSYELAARRHSCVSFCGKDMAVLEKLKKAFQTSYYHVNCTDDIAGVETAVAFKNAYALAVTISVGMLQRTEPEAMAYNPQAGIFGQAVREMMRMVRFMGGSEERLDVAAGDLYVTIYGGRTRRLGVLLGQGLSYKEARARLEGVTLESVEIAVRAARSIRMLDAAGILSKEDFPLIMHVDDIISHGAEAAIPWDSFR